MKQVLKNDNNIRISKLFFGSLCRAELKLFNYCIQRHPAVTQNVIQGVKFNSFGAVLKTCNFYNIEPIFNIISLTESSLKIIASQCQRFVLTTKNLRICSEILPSLLWYYHWIYSGFIQTAALAANLRKMSQIFPSLNKFIFQTCPKKIKFNLFL